MMQNLSNIMVDKTDNDEYSSFCSSCNSMLQSVYSIGVPSFLELDNENYRKSIIENNVYTRDNCRKYQEEDTIEINCTKKKPKYMASLNENVPNTSETICTKDMKSKNKTSDKTNLEEIQRISHNLRGKTGIIPDMKNKNFSSKILKFNNALDYESLSKSVSEMGNSSNCFSEANLLLIKQKKSTRVVQSTLVRRKNIHKRLQSILHLCNRINFMREIILRVVRQKKFSHSKKLF